MFFLMVSAAGFSCCVEKNICGNAYSNGCCSQPESYIHAPCICGQTMANPSAQSFEIKFTSELSLFAAPAPSILAIQEKPSIFARFEGHERDPVLGSKINKDRFCRQFISKKDFV
jgi:hypothetical protein